MNHVAHMERHGLAADLPYRLYLPAESSAGPYPLLVMLHGCLQDAAAFSAATHMLEHASRVALLFPEQPAESNPQRCWNWFNPANQRRDGGEAARIAELTRQVVAEYNIDERRIYVAGISAGGMMAAIMAATYPDIYAALGVHSAGAFPTATTVAEALAVMRGDALDETTAVATGAAAVTAMHTRVRSMPAVILHGVADGVVNVANAEHAAHSWWHVHARASGAPMVAHVARRSGHDGGREYVVESFSDGAGSAPVIELWRVDGLGHAWSGGVAGGSYADAAGPDAARIMLDFLLKQRLP